VDKAYDVADLLERDRFRDTLNSLERFRSGLLAVIV
jgi:hypothetical protein